MGTEPGYSTGSRGSGCGCRLMTWGQDWRYRVPSDHALAHVQWSWDLLQVSFNSLCGFGGHCAACVSRPDSRVVLLKLVPLLLEVNWRQATRLAKLAANVRPLGACQLQQHQSILDQTTISQQHKSNTQPAHSTVVFTAEKDCCCTRTVRQAVSKTLVPLSRDRFRSHPEAS